MMRSRPGRKFPKLTGVIAVVPALLLAGCSAESIRDSGGAVVSAGPWSVFDLRPGDCITDASVEDSDMVPLVPCDEPHGQEVYAVITSTDTSYPGGGALASRGDEQCLSGLSGLGSQVPEGIPFSYLLPSETTWQENNDRAIVCVLIFPGGQALGSFVSGTADLGTIG